MAPLKRLRNVFLISSSIHSSITASSSSSSSSSSQSPHSTTSTSPTSNTATLTGTPSSTPTDGFSESTADEKVEQAKRIITKWDPNSSTFARVTSLFYQSRSQAKEFLNSVNQLQQAMHFYASSSSSSSAKLLHAQNLMQIAMKRLQKEFYQILSSNRDHLDPESISLRSSVSARSSSTTTVSDYEEDPSSEDEIQIAGESISQVEGFSALAMADLRSVAECMISSGYAKECVNIYKTMRKSIVDEALYNLRVEHLTSSQIRKMDCDVLELKIKNWLNAVKIAVKSLFHGERIVCDHVFSSSDLIRGSCFSDITKEGAILLFRFPKSVAKFHKSPEKIFRMLDLYNAIAELFPDIDFIFSPESTSEVRSQALNSLTTLADTVRSMLLDFESAIQNESSKTPIPGGSIHPLTRYAMNYLSFLADYRGILSGIIASCPLPQNAYLPKSYFDSSCSSEHNSSSLPPLATRMAWIILVLLCKLDVKARLYKDSALAYLFLTNNLEYVLQKVQTSNLGLLLGENWISIHRATVKQYTESYLRVGWSKVFLAIPEDLTATAMTLEEAKQCFNSFNSAFEHVCRTQSSWVVTDGKVREEIKLSIAKKLRPAYRDFYNKYEDMVRRTNDLGSVIRFCPDDLENYLSDLFYGPGGSSAASSSPMHDGSS